MKVAIEARALSTQGSGVKTYTYELVRELLKRGLDEQYVVLLDAAHSQGVLPDAQEIVLPLRHQALLGWWLQHQVPAVLKKLVPDVIHYTKADVPARKLVPTVVTVHDIIPLLFPESQNLSRRWYWPRALDRAVRASDQIITISETSKRDITERLGYDSDRIAVTPLSIDRERFNEKISQEVIEQMKTRYGLARPYILFLGTRDVRKNVGGLLRAWAQVAPDVPHQLIVAGKQALRRDEARAEAERLGLLEGERVRFLPFVPRAELPALYAGAELLVWPSVYEGWGLPPLEAMACGTAVIVSDGGALPEAVGDAGIVVPFAVTDVRARLKDQDFEGRLVKEIRRVLENEDLRRKLELRGRQRADKYSWEKVAELTAAVYRQAAGR